MPKQPSTIVRPTCLTFSIKSAIKEPRAPQILPGGYMKNDLRYIVGILLLAFGSISYVHTKWTAPSPYEVCEKKQTQAERDQCKAIVGFALSAGW